VSLLGLELCDVVFKDVKLLLDAIFGVISHQVCVFDSPFKDFNVTIDGAMDLLDSSFKIREVKVIVDWDLLIISPAI